MRFASMTVLALALALFGCSGEPGMESPAAGEDEGLEHVHHFAWVSEKISRGGQPMGEEAFRELSEQGVKVILNVDGARPDVENAKKYGMRYVHIPIGYDGITEDQRLKIAKTVRELEGPFFIHCHHGKHRGPAAAVVAEMAIGDMTNEEAVAEMEAAGTAEKYRGLWACAREYEAPAEDATATVAFDFPEVAPVPAMVDAMARVDRIWDNLKLCRAEDWGVPSGHPDVSPPHETLQMLELFVEMARTDEMKEYDESFHGFMDEAIEGSRTLEAELRKDPVDLDAAEAAFRQVSQSCSKCHSDYRNNK